MQLLKHEIIKSRCCAGAYVQSFIESHINRGNLDLHDNHTQNLCVEYLTTTEAIDAS